MKNDIQVYENIQLSLNDFGGDTCLLVHVSVCNLYCKYCFNMPGLIKYKAVSFNDVVLPKILTYIKKHKCPKNLTISGGEPTSEVGFVNVLKHLKELGFNTRLYTNGTYPKVIAAALPYISCLGMDIKAPILDIYRDNKNFNFREISYMLFRKDKYVELKLDAYINHLKDSLRVLIDSSFVNVELRTTFNDTLLKSGVTCDKTLSEFIVSIDNYMETINSDGLKFDYFIQRATPTKEVDNFHTSCSVDLYKIYSELDINAFRNLKVKIR